MTTEPVIAPLDLKRSEDVLDALDMLLRDAVESGRVGGIPAATVAGRSARLLAGNAGRGGGGNAPGAGAWPEEQLVGTVHLALATKPNGRHRGEVQKLLVRTTARRRGIAQKLLGAIERAALEFGRTLLVLDTEQGSGGRQAGLRPPSSGPSAPSLLIALTMWGDG